MGIKRHIAPVGRDLVVNSIINGRVIPGRLRGRLLRRVGHQVHPNALICPDVFLGSRHGLSVGARALVNYGCFFDLLAPTTIGADCAIGYRTMFLTGTHNLGASDRRAAEVQAAPITVGDGCWIGANVIILPGVTIGRGSVVAAGSVVRASVPPNSLVAGVPATVKRQL